MEYFKQIHQHITHNDLPKIVTLWEEYCMGDEIDFEELMLILKDIKSSPLCDAFGVYVEQILPLWKNLTDEEQAFKILGLVVDIQTKNDLDLATLSLEWITKRFGQSKHFAQKLRLVGLKDGDQFKGAISSFELLEHLKKGSFVFHTSGWGVGEVIDVSFLREEASFEFDYVASIKELSFENCFKTLVPIPNDHFLALRFGQPDELEKRAKKDPIKVLRLLLKDLGPKTAGEIKEELCELVIPEEEWTKWWQSARAKLKKDTLIESPKSVKKPFMLRDEELSHEDRMHRIFEKKPDTDNLIEVLYAFMRDFPTALKNDEFKQNLVAKLEEIESERDATAIQSIQFAIFIHDLGGKPKTPIKTLIKGLQSIEEQVEKVKVTALKKRVMIYIAKAREDWDKIFLHFFLHVDHNSVRDYIFNELLKKGKREQLENILKDLFQKPHLHPTAFLWYYHLLSNSDREDIPYASREGHVAALEAFFVLFYLLEQKGQQRDLIKKMQQILKTERFAYVRKVFSGASLDEVNEILLLSTKCLQLDEHDIKILRSLAAVVYPEINQQDEVDTITEDEVIWTTQEGYIKVKEKIHQIATVETVENAKEIEVARSHGDLRENSEFKFALEKRDRLQSELKTLSDQIGKMRVITEGDIDIREVGVGSVCTMESNSGKTVSYTLLGPWDANPEKHILSIQSKLAKVLMGAKVGEKRMFQNEEWTIKEIRSFLEPQKKV